MGELLFYLDIAAALSIPAATYGLYRKGLVSRAVWRMFWAGVIIGSTWEVGFYFIGPEHSSDPIYVMHSEFPGPTILLHLLHTLWDGGIFLVGAWLVKRLCRQPRFERFRWQELAVMLAWGQAQELAVELVGSSGGMWEYQPRWWNPVMFRFRGRNITLVPQLVWLAAPVAFYLAALRVNARFAGSAGSAGGPDQLDQAG